MSQSLVINITHVYVDFHFIAKYSRHHVFVSVVVIAVLHKLFSEEVDGIIILIFFKCFSIDEFSVKGTTFTSEGFDKHTNCHSRWESVRVNDNVWSNTLLGERHVFLWPDLTHYTLLTMS